MKNPQTQHTATHSLILQALKEGDRNACEMIYRQYRAKIWSCILFFVKSEKIADEVTFEVFFKIWEQRQDICPKTFNSFVQGLCHDLTYRKLRDIFSEETSREEMWQAIHALQS